MKTLIAERYLPWVRILFVAALVTVLVLSLLPLSHPDFSSNDKVNHLIAYAGLAFLGLLSIASMFRVTIGVFLWGLLIECLQGLTEYRMFSVGDMVANGLGVLIGLLIWQLSVKWAGKLNNN